MKDTRRHILVRSSIIFSGGNFFNTEISESTEFINTTETRRAQRKDCRLGLKQNEDCHSERITGDLIYFDHLLRDGTDSTDEDSHSEESPGTITSCLVIARSL